MRVSESGQTGSVVLSARRRISRSAVGRDANRPTELVAFTRFHWRPDGPVAAAAAGATKALPGVWTHEAHLETAALLLMSWDETATKPHRTIMQQANDVF